MARKLSRQGERALEAANAAMEAAWNATEPAERRALAAKALALSPLCAEAHMLLAELTDDGSPEAIAHWRRAVSAGAAAIGPSGFRALTAMGDRPEHAEPYLDALHGLAEALWTSGARGEAIETLQRMLTVDPSDETGVRYRLLGWFLEEGHDDAARLILLGTLRDDDNAWPWAAALMGFRSRGADGQSRLLLRQAVAANPQVARRLLGPDKAPESLKGEVDGDEAIDALLVTGALEDPWLNTPGALDWLEGELPALLQEIEDGYVPDGEEEGVPSAEY